MPFFVVEAQVKPGAEAAFRDAVRAALEPTRAEPGNIAYTFAECPFEPGRVLFFEEWKSAADIDAHFASPHVRQLLATVMPLLAAPPAMRLVEPARVETR